MAISEPMNDGLNEQIGHTFAGAIQNWTISAYLISEGLPQLATHFARLADGERGHALRLAQHVVDAGGQLAIPAIPAPVSHFASPEAAVIFALGQERGVSKQMEGLLDLAVEQGDHRTRAVIDDLLREHLRHVEGLRVLARLMERGGDSGLVAIEALLSTGGLQELGGILQSRQAPVHEPG
jgi:ferritin